jgi:hypothetical protein
VDIAASVRGTVQEAGLGGDEQQRAFGHERQRHDRGADVERADPPAAGEQLPQRGVQRLAALELHLVQEVAEQDAARGEGERRGHVEHRLPPVVDPRLAQDADAVAHRLDPGVGAAAERKRAQHDDAHSEPSELRDGAVRFGDGGGQQAAEIRGVAQHAVADECNVRGDEDQEDRRQHHHRFLDAAQVEQDEPRDHRVLGEQLDAVEARGHEGVDRVAAGRHGDRDGEHVVHHQRTARDHARRSAQQLGRDQVAASAGRKLLDDVAVGGGDEEHRADHRGDQVEREVAVRAELAKDFLGAVAREESPSDPSPTQAKNAMSARCWWMRGSNRFFGAPIRKPRSLEIAGVGMEPVDPVVPERAPWRRVNRNRASERRMNPSPGIKTASRPLVRRRLRR